MARPRRITPKKQLSQHPEGQDAACAAIPEVSARIRQLSPQPVASDEAPSQDRIARAITEVNLEQLATGRNMTPAQRIQHAFDLIEEAEQAAVARLRSVWPELSETKEQRIYRSGQDDDWRCGARYRRHAPDQVWRLLHTKKAADSSGSGR
ncbi:MAG: hypothetical protein IAE85_08825 [Anaerolinea sp.]|nr:hypothetical protein [Anaerolinea sp.]